MVKHLTAVIILAVSLSAWTQAATYGGGTGMAESPLNCSAVNVCSLP